MIKTEKFGNLSNGEEISKITLQNRNGMKAVVTDIGACLVNLWVKDKNGKLRDVVTGFDELERYEKNFSCFGATIGRVANRISHHKFTLNGVEYSINPWEGPNGTMLHSFPNSYSLRKWNFVIEEGEGEDSVTFYLHSPNLDQGYPGNCDVELTYTLTDDNDLQLQYYGLSDEDTPFNMTNHSFFNLNGHESGDVLDQVLQINSDTIPLYNDDLCPNGGTTSCLGTPYDFTKAKPIGQDIAADDYWLNKCKGYDLCYIVNGGKKLEEAEQIAEAYSKESGIRMEVYTDLPSVQLYTANLDVNKKPYYVQGGKGGTNYPNHCAFCLETQFVPDSIKLDTFEKEMIYKNQEFVSLTVYRFTTGE